MVTNTTVLRSQNYRISNFLWKISPNPGNNTLADFTAPTSPANTILFLAGAGFALPGAAATAKPLGGLFVEGGFSAPSQRFAYTPATGNLYYSASGTTAGEHLVAHLAGNPTLSAAQIAHLVFAT